MTLTVSRINNTPTNTLNAISLSLHDDVHVFEVVLGYTAHKLSVNI